MQRVLSRRPALPGDDGFLRAAFAESRPEFALFPDAVRDQVVGLQFGSQAAEYRRAFPAAVDWIVELDDRGPVGRCYHWAGPDEHRLLDLAIRCEFRRRGLGSRVLEELQDEAARAGVPLRLAVWHANHDALRLYRSLGFEADDRAEPGGPSGYLALAWQLKVVR